MLVEDQKIEDLLWWNGDTILLLGVSSKVAVDNESACARTHAHTHTHTHTHTQ
jgi:hypothetical protein